MQNDNATLTAETFQTHLARFVAEAQAMVNKHYEQYQHVKAPTIGVHADGKRFVRIVKIESHGSKSVYCFVEKATGDIYKAASWKAPAKGVRGNVAKPAASSCTDHGAVYWR